MSTVFFDIDTQIDFLFPTGALYVPDAERLLPALQRLNQFAVAHNIPVVSSTCAHAEEDPEFQDWPPHCVIDTVGQAKPAELLLERRVVVSTRPGSIALNGAQQIILEKQQLDLFTSPNLVPLLDVLHAEEYFVYGVVTEYCVRFAALGLLATGKRVQLVTDAIQTLKQADSDRTLQEFTARGGKLTTVSEVCVQ